MEHKHSAEQLAIKNEFVIGRNHFLVKAVAGSSKTYTCILGINSANSPRMVYCTFNKRTQLEAAQKITNPNVQVSTYHSIGYRSLLGNWRGVKASGYAEYGRCKKIAPEAPALVHFQAAKLVSFLKNTFVKIPTLKEATDTAVLRDIDCQKHADLWTCERLAQLAIDSIKISLEYPADRQISFEDMIFIPTVLGMIKPAYTLVISDESQDLNPTQMAMLKALCEDKGRICLVGDPAQNIYNFRGSMSNSMDKFKSEFNAKEFTLSTSYRCPKVVVSLAQTLVPQIKAADNAIQGEIQNITHDKMLVDIKVNEVVLSRTNAPLAKSCLALLRKNKPAYIVGKDIGKQLIDLINSFEVNDINEFYNRLDGWLAVKRAKATLWNAGAVAHAVDTAETLRVLAESCLTVSDIKNKIEKLFVDSESVRVPSVILSTVHKAKGLEWNSVHLLSESFASRRQMTPEQAQEEKNIAYVAYTRSQNKLVHVAG